MKAKSKANLLLIELILAILFFSLSVSVCIRLVFSAYSVSEKNRALTRATVAADSVLNSLQDSESGDVEKLVKMVFSNAVKNNDVYEVYFDKDFVPVSSKEEAKYDMNITVKDEKNLRNISLDVEDILKDKEAQLMKVETAYYIYGGK